MQQLTTRGWRKLKSVLRPLPPRAENAYATHIPVLVGLGSIRRIERVLEFGCGHYSTKTFLRRSVFRICNCCTRWKTIRGGRRRFARR